MYHIMNFKINDIRKNISITVIQNRQFAFKHLSTNIFDNRTLRELKVMGIIMWVSKCLKVVDYKNHMIHMIEPYEY